MCWCYYYSDKLGNESQDLSGAPNETTEEGQWGWVQGRSPEAGTPCSQASRDHAGGWLRWHQHCPTDPQYPVPSPPPQHLPDPSLCVLRPPGVGAPRPLAPLQHDRSGVPLPEPPISPIKRPHRVPKVGPHHRCLRSTTPFSPERQLADSLQEPTEACGFGVGDVCPSQVLLGLGAACGMRCYDFVRVPGGRWSPVSRARGGICTE